jgi:hypothetical protein
MISNNKEAKETWETPHLGGGGGGGCLQVYSEHSFLRGEGYQQIYKEVVYRSLRKTRFYSGIIRTVSTLWFFMTNIVSSRGCQHLMTSSYNLTHNCRWYWGRCTYCVCIGNVSAAAEMPSSPTRNPPTNTSKMRLSVFLRIKMSLLWTVVLFTSFSEADLYIYIYWISGYTVCSCTAWNLNMLNWIKRDFDVLAIIYA